MQPYTNIDNTTQCDAAKSQQQIQAIKELRTQGYTDGLIRSLQENRESFPMRFWVVDDSYSMTYRDEHILRKLPFPRVRVADGSRWAVNHHARTAALLEAPTTFRLLNPLGVAAWKNGDDLETTRTIRANISPFGRTSLTTRVNEITADIAAMADDLRAKGQKAVVVLATDGLPTNRRGQHTRLEQIAFKDALARMEGLPVRVVIRLCTDNDEVATFYNNLESQLVLSLDVLDDYITEALEVYEHNRWLNYALPIHRMREMGFCHKLFDRIDQRPLTKDELPEFFRLLFGADVLDESLPDPHLNWAGFLRRIAAATESQPDQYNPLMKRATPWVMIEKLDQIYGGRRRKLPRAIDLCGHISFRDSMQKARDSVTNTYLKIAVDALFRGTKLQSRIK